MSGIESASLWTIAWCLMTGTLFLILARWSVATSSWTVLPGIVRGVQAWVDRSPDERTEPSPRAAAPDEDAAVAEVIGLRR